MQPAVNRPTSEARTMRNDWTMTRFETALFVVAALLVAGGFMMAATA
jgi:hypothetical protein